VTLFFLFLLLTGNYLIKSMSHGDPIGADAEMRSAGWISTGAGGYEMAPRERYPTIVESIMLSHPGE